MPVMINDSAGLESMELGSFSLESDLEGLLAENPELLRFNDDPELILVDRQVHLPNAGVLDLLYLNKDGLLIAVEVKLERNDESRRKIVAQAIDYLADLSAMDVDAINTLTGNKLVSAMKSLSSSEDGGEHGFETMRARVVENLRSGRLRCLAVLDTAPDSLVRMFGFLIGHSSLDTRLVTVQKHAKGNATVVVSNQLVSADTVSMKGESRKQRDFPVLDNLVEIYHRHQSKKIEFVSDARGNYRQILPREWYAKGVHYEYRSARGKILAEIHLEKDDALVLQSYLKGLDGCTLNGSNLVWDRLWSKGRGALGLSFDIEDADPQVIHDAMIALIDLTYDEVRRMLGVPV